MMKPKYYFQTREVKEQEEEVYRNQNEEDMKEE